MTRAKSRKYELGLFELRDLFLARYRQNSQQSSAYPPSCLNYLCGNEFIYTFANHKLVYMRLSGFELTSTKSEFARKEIEIEIEIFERLLLSKNVLHNLSVAR